MNELIKHLLLYERVVSFSKSVNQSKSQSINSPVPHWQGIRISISQNVALLNRLKRTYHKTNLLRERQKLFTGGVKSETCDPLEIL